MKKEFEKLQHEYPNLSSCMCFVRLVSGKKLNENVLRDMFNDMVDKKDYQGTPKEQIISWLLREIN